jgi:hypothetical protein
MRNVSLLLILGFAALTTRVIAQEIVIEPTNGRAQSANRVNRPATVESAPARAKKPAEELSAAKKVPKAPKKVPAKQLATTPKKDAPLETRPAVSAVAEVAKNEAPKMDSTPARKSMPTRPEWAMADSRDARTLRIEIASALAHDPALTGSSIEVNVDDSTVTLEGHADGSQERLQAERLAQSYAWNRKLVDHIEIVRGVSAQK